MKITYIAASGILVEHQGTRILCDPWINGPAYYGSWHHNPKLEFTVADIGPVDYLYLSHIHQDHTHLPTLKDVRTKDGEKPPVLMAPYAETYMGTMLRGRGFTTHELKPQQRVKVGNIGMEIVAADLCNPDLCGRHFGCPLPKASGKSWQLDSIGVFFTEDKKQIVVNVNDTPHGLAEQAAKYITSVYGPPTMLLVNIAMAGAWPQAHEFPQALKVARARIKHRDSLANAAKFVEWIPAKVIVPMGDVYTLGGRLAPLNQYRGAVDVEDIEGNGVLKMNRMGWFDLDTMQADAPYVDRDFWAMERYTNDVLAQLPFEYDGDPEPTDLPELVDEAQTAFWARCRDHGALHDWEVTLKWNGSQKTVTANPNLEKADARMTITLDPKLFRRLLKRKANWHVAEIGSHLLYHRDPDRFEHGVYRAMNYFHV